MISFIIPFCTIEKASTLKLDEKRQLIKASFQQTNSQLIAESTDKVIKNIGKHCNREHEIIVVDNSNTFEWFLNQDDYKNLRVIKGWQYRTEKDIMKSENLDINQCLENYNNEKSNQNYEMVKYALLKHFKENNLINYECLIRKFKILDKSKKFNQNLKNLILY